MKNNKQLENLSNKIVNDSGLSGCEEYGSVLLTIMIIGIILNSIRVIQECHSSKLNKMSKEEKHSFLKDQIRTLSNRRGWFTKMRIRKVMRQEMKKDTYKQYGANIVDSILNSGENITDDELSSILEALNV